MVQLFFLGQYVLASLMAPSFAAGTVTGEKERKTYEMLLASPLRPGAIVLGKLLASLAPLAILIFSSLPIVMLCLPLGGVSLYEVLAAYLALMLSVAAFGMISVACSSYFQRTAAALIVSYLLILPLALTAVLSWNAMAGSGELRLVRDGDDVCRPAARRSAACCSCARPRRLLHPPDVGSEGKEVVDLAHENEKAVGMVIQFDQFPDRLLAPAKRTTLLRDGANPVFDKELRSEIFSQGTLMLRLVVQVSMFLALPMMAALPVLEGRFGPLVYRLCAAVQRAGRAGVFGRQRHQRARAANARPAAHDDHQPVSDSVGQADRRAAGVVGADVVSGLAGAVGLGDGVVRLAATFWPCRRFSR